MIPVVEDRVVQLNETALVQAVAQREDAAVKRFYETYADAVLRFVYRQVGERYEDAEEITQDVFLLAVSLAGTYDGSCSVFTWLCSLAKRCLGRFQRWQGRGKRIPPEKVVSLEDEALQLLQELDRGAPSMDDVLTRIDTAQLVEVMVASLADEEREALLLRYVEEFSVREIAGLLQRSEKAIESLLMRAKRKAARAVGVEYEGKERIS